MIPLAEFRYNTSYQSALGTTPFEVILANVFVHCNDEHISVWHVQHAKESLLVLARASKNVFINIVYVVSNRIKGDVELLLIAAKAILALPRSESPLPNNIVDIIDPFEQESPSSII